MDINNLNDVVSSEIGRYLKFQEDVDKENRANAKAIKPQNPKTPKPHLSKF